MSERFQKGQLVAVRDDANGRWSIWFYDHASPEGLHFCRSPNRMIGPRWWRYAVPAEEVWPELFLDRDSETMNLMRRMRRDFGVKLRQVEWLCEQLQDINADLTGHPFCPSDESSCDCQPGCAKCWEKASLEAVMEGREKEKSCP